MSTQKAITSYFTSSKFTQAPMDMKSTKRKLSLKKDTPKLTVGVVVISSDDDDSDVIPSPQPTLNLSQHSLEEGMSSDSSSKTIIYTYSPQTPKKTIASTNGSSGLEIKEEITPVKPKCKSPLSEKKCFLNTQTSHSFSSPCSSKLTSPNATLKQPTPSSKFFSPTKRRKVGKKSPEKPRRNLNDIFNNCNQTLRNDINDELYLKACEGQEDKTKFLLKIVHEFIKTESLKKFLDDESLQLLVKFFELPKYGMKLVCRLYWRKEGWYKKEQIRDICLETKDDNIDEKEFDKMLKVLVERNYLIEASNQNMTFNELTSLLKAEELKDICKELKIKTQTKKSAVESLQEFTRRSSICDFFGGIKAPSNEKRLLQIMSQKAGPSYKLSDLTRNTLDKLYILTYLGIDYDYIREKRLELMLINEKIERETFPVDKNMPLDNASIIFEDKRDFESYLHAHTIQEMYLTATDTDVKCSLVRQAYELFININPNDIVRYKSLPIWLQRYTPASIYVKVMDAGIQELKKGKNQANCHLAAEILSTLIAQTFRQHKKAEWYAVKALVLHSYLNKAEEAAYVLVEGFESNISEETKDFMRPRAMKIAQQKNITIDDELRKLLLAFATKETILEVNIPSQHFYKQPMENITKGKAMYETKSESGRVMQGVEEYALSCYLLNGEYTNGGHWEGRIITTMFYLLFWEIIYSKPRHVSGIFLSHYQRHPLDMFSEEFYSNRCDAIEKRLQLIEQCTDDDIVEIMMIEWDNRPEHEMSGINRNIACDDIFSIGRCLGGRRLAAICRRLVTDYRHSHSGFPDLTLWNPATKKVKFVEVKSDNDKPSMKQIQWMQFLLDSGIETEFCYIGANTTRSKARGSITKVTKKRET